MFRHSFESLRGDCYKVRDFEAEFASAMGAPHGLAVTSGTAALRVALAALGIGPGDEVIVPTMTFAASANCVVYQGATPIFADVDTDTDTFANSYVIAPAPADMANVTTLRVELVVRSLANRITRTAVPYTLEGTVIPLEAGDLHLYKVMTSTITLRNKGT